MRLHEAKKDHYRKLAKEEGYRSRSAYKLMQIDQKYKIIKRGFYVLDFGAAPGGWLEVLSKRITNKGLAIGIDIKAIEYISENVITLECDINDSNFVKDIKHVTEDEFDLILSDIAPNVTGMWEVDQSVQIDLTEKIIFTFDRLMKKNGNAVLKVFEGTKLSQLEKTLKNKFRQIRRFKPPASRGASSEMYLICIDFHKSD